MRTENNPDRDAFEELFWSKRPPKGFGWTTLPAYTDAFLSALIETLSRPETPAEAWEFWLALAALAGEEQP